MQKLKKILHTSVLYLFALMLVGSVPLTVAAEEVVEPKQPVYVYNEATGHWDSDVYYWDPITGRYQPVAPTSTTTPPPSLAPVSDEEAAALLIDETGPGSTNNSTIEPTGTVNTDIDTANKIGNDIDMNSLSGDATVDSNVFAGNAGTGDSTGMTTLINTVHSTIGGDTAGVATFEADIYGNVIGDITLSPIIDSFGSSTPRLTDINTSVKSDNQIINDVDVNATSGDASVTNNTTAGDATSGDAHTVANIVNLINSIIASNKSFIGTINIYGNLDGDILVSPEFIPQLLAHNSQPNPADPLIGDFTSNLSDTSSIVNNIQLGAESGSANVSSNTNGGNATTGTANTNLTVLNLTGKQVVAKNSLLVFVNVLGKWVGMIVDAPEGTTAAAIGSGVTTNTGGPGSTTIDSDNNSTITNNVNLASRSGDANVTSNTNGGNAQTGNATASANLLNINTSTFAVSDWFGILFINVLGEWYGSFGVNTANGEVRPLGGMALSPVAPIATSAPPFQFGFNPHGSGVQTSYGGGTVGNDEGGSSGVVLASAKTAAQQSVAIIPQSSAQEENNRLNSYIMMIVGFLTVFGTLLYKALRRRHQVPIAMTDASSI